MRARGPAPPVPTLDSLRPAWVWVHCTNSAAHCHHAAPMAVTPLVIRWGFGVSTDRLRQCAKCTRCGHRGAMLTAPSWVDMQVGEQPFPTGGR